MTGLGLKLQSNFPKQAEKRRYENTLTMIDSIPNDDYEPVPKGGSVIVDEADPVPEAGMPLVLRVEPRRPVNWLPLLFERCVVVGLEPTDGLNTQCVRVHVV